MVGSPAFTNIVHVLVLLAIILASGYAQQQCDLNVFCTTIQSGSVYNCSGRSLTDIPACMPMTVQQLELSSNSFTAVPQSLAGLLALVSLNLTNNPITLIPAYSFATLSNLQTL